MLYTINAHHQHLQQPRSFRITLRLPMRFILYILLFTLSTLTFAVDYKKYGDAVDEQKAADSVDKEQLKGSVEGGEIDYTKAAGSVDKEQAANSVDVNKAKEAIVDDYGY